ncbi:jg14952 [Pararge aegeria aegeria]|uniref:Jg14952 protein n=1 Tax=Pararge aegeria aegeria TaxID=348720 RepID=A0A8S4SDR2_9NEOP|nr:jg14952 [Pararge aegeria aegeria]
MTFQMGKTPCWADGSQQIEAAQRALLPVLHCIALVASYDIRLPADVVRGVVTTVFLSSFTKWLTFYTTLLTVVKFARYEIKDPQTKDFVVKGRFHFVPLSSALGSIPGRSIEFSPIIPGYCLSSIPREIGEVKRTQLVLSRAIKKMNYIEF